MDPDPNLFIRIFQNDDAEAVSRLIIDNILQVNVKTCGKAAARKLASLYTPAHILKYAEKGEMYVAEIPDGDVGLVGTVTLEEERVRNLFVRVDVHGQGIGERLMGFIENLAVRNGLVRVFLLADLPAADFYEKLGYARKGERLELIKSARFKMVAMEKELPAGAIPLPEGTGQPG